LEENKEQENNERDTLYNTTKQISDKIQQQEISINIENNNKDEKRDNVKEKKLERMIDDKTDNSYSNIEDMYTNDNTTLSSIVNSTIYDLQALLSQRQDGLSSVLYEHYQYNTSINGKRISSQSRDSKLSLVVMYAHLVGSIKTSIALVQAFLLDFVNYFE
jgi:hypothetical protein